eukprot:3888766-Rhodomonas_salina.4
MESSHRRKRDSERVVHPYALTLRMISSPSNAVDECARACAPLGMSLLAAYWLWWGSVYRAAGRKPW